MNCVICGKVIPNERAELFKTCKDCTPQGKMIGFMDYGHKTAPSIVIVSPNDKDSLRKAKRAFWRSR